MCTCVHNIRTRFTTRCALVEAGPYCVPGSPHVFLTHHVHDLQRRDVTHAFAAALAPVHACPHGPQRPQNSEKRGRLVARPDAIDDTCRLKGPTCPSTTPVDGREPLGACPRGAAALAYAARGARAGKEGGRGGAASMRVMHASGLAVLAVPPVRGSE